MAKAERTRSDASTTVGWWARALTVCAASGLLAVWQAGRAPMWLVGIALVLFVALLLLRRPEAVLLGAAAFPWLDWLARQTLGGVGAAWDEGLLLVALLLVVWGAVVTGRLRLRTVPITLPVLFASRPRWGPSW